MLENGKVVNRNSKKGSRNYVFNKSNEIYLDTPDNNVIINENQSQDNLNSEELDKSVCQIDSCNNNDVLSNNDSLDNNNTNLNNSKIDNNLNMAHTTTRKGRIIKPPNYLKDYVTK